MRFRCGIAVAAGALRLAGGVGLDHRDLAVGGGADAARGALAFGAPLGRLALALGLHAPIDRLHIGLGQVDALDADVDDLHAELARFLIHLAQDGAHQRLALVAHHRLEGRAAEHAPERGFENGADPRIGDALVAHALEEQQGSVMR